MISAAVAWHAQAGVDAHRHPFGLHENHPYGLLSGTVESPHITWAKPYAGGTIRGLVMTYTWAQRETVELAQRLSFDFTPWMTHSYTELASPVMSDLAYSYFHAHEKTVLEALDRAMDRQVDVIVIGKLRWELIPAEKRFQLLKSVSQGTGLVYVSPPEVNEELAVLFNQNPTDEGLQFIIRGVPLADLPHIRDVSVNDLVQLSTYGKGRVVRIEYREPRMVRSVRHALTPAWVSPNFIAYPRSEPMIDESFYYDYDLSLVAKAVVWAAGKEPHICFEQFKLPPAMHRRQLENHSVQLRLRNLGKNEQPYDLAMTIRNLDSEVECRRRLTGVELPTGISEHRMSLPMLRAGHHVADVWIQRNGETINWASKFFQVQADLVIEKVAMTQRIYDKEEQIKGQIVLNAPLGRHQTLELHVEDTLHRVVHREPVAGGQTRIPFRFQIPEPLTILHEVTVTLNDPHGTVQRVKEEVSIRRKTLDDFNIIPWFTSSNDWVTKIARRQLYELGIDINYLTHAGVYFRAWPGRPAELHSAEETTTFYARSAARAGFRSLPYVLKIGPFASSPNRVAEGCPNRDPFRIAVAKKMTENGSIWGPHSPVAYSLGDENALSHRDDICVCERCLAGFCDYLKNQYGTLKELNSDWGTRFDSWEYVQPIPLNEARDTGRFAQWADHRVYMETVFADAHRHARTAIRKSDPSARVGFDGAGWNHTPTHGVNWSLLGNVVDMSCDYNGIQIEINRSFLRPDALRGIIYGSYGQWVIGPSEERYVRYFPWYALFHHKNSVMWWTAGLPDEGSGGVTVFRPDLSVLPYFRQTMEEIHEIKRGIATLILNAKRDNNGIAIHYSPLGKMAASLTAEVPTDKGESWGLAITDVAYLLEELGLQYDFMDSEQIEAGNLIHQGFKVLFLPYSQALSQDEVASMKAFVAGGGSLFSIGPAGTMDEHCRPLQVGLLEKLLPDAETWATTDFGRGKAVYMGNAVRAQAVRQYTGSHREEWREKLPAQRDFAAMLSNHGVRSPVTIRNTRGTGLPPTEVTLFRQGQAFYVSLARPYFLEDHGEYEAVIRFPAKGYLYDIRTKQYLGMTDEIETILDYRARLYAVLPYQVRGLQLDVGKGKYALGERVSFHAALKLEDENSQPVRHVIHVEMMDAKRRAIPYHRRNLTTTNGFCSGSFPLSLNRTPGDYLIRATDVATGIQAEQSVEILP